MQLCIRVQSKVLYSLELFLLGAPEQSAAKCRYGTLHCTRMTMAAFTASHHNMSSSHHQLYVRAGWRNIQQVGGETGSCGRIRAFPPAGRETAMPKGCTNVMASHHRGLLPIAGGSADVICYYFPYYFKNIILLVLVQFSLENFENKEHI